MTNDYWPEKMTKEEQLNINWAAFKDVFSAYIYKLKDGAEGAGTLKNFVEQSDISVLLDAVKHVGRNKDGDYFFKLGDLEKTYTELFAKRYPSVRKSNGCKCCNDDGQIVIVEVAEISNGAVKYRLLETSAPSIRRRSITPCMHQCGCTGGSFIEPEFNWCILSDSKRLELHEAYEKARRYANDCLTLKK